MIPARRPLPDPAPSEAPALPPLHVVRGTVVAARRRTLGVRAPRGGGYGAVDDVPELWLRDAEGREHHAWGGPLVEAREGHEVVLAWRADGGLEGSRNVTARTRRLDPKADPARCGWKQGEVGSIASIVVSLLAAWVLTSAFGVAAVGAMALVLWLGVRSMPARRARFQTRYRAVCTALGLLEPEEDADASVPVWPAVGDGATLRPGPAVSVPIPRPPEEG